MIKHLLSLTVCAAVAICGSNLSSADQVFDFTGGAASAHFDDLDNLGSGTTSVGSLSVTATALSTAGVPELNFHSGDGLGVNIDANGDDESNKLDAGVGIESIDLVFNKDLVLDGIAIDGMGWGSDVDYEYADILVNNVYFGTLLDTDADAATTALHGNAIIGGSSDTFTDLGVALSSGDTLTITYGEVGANNGWRIESLTTVPEPSSLAVLIGFGMMTVVRRR